jgi:glutathione S-transferase
MKLYGVATSRASRNIWLINELDLDVERLAVVQAYRLEEQGLDPRAQDAPLNTLSAEFLALSPAGMVPLLEHDGLILFESLAINNYLAQQAAWEGAEIGPRDDTERALIEQWALYGTSVIEGAALDIMWVHSHGRAGSNAGQAELADLRAKLLRPLAVLEAHLVREGVMVGGRFTVADINMAEIIRYAALDAPLMERFGAIRAWLDRCHARPAFKMMMAERAAEIAAETCDEDASPTANSTQHDAAAPPS